jgi:2-keto-3-deoxy-6-phosphogluconate aldolase
VRTDHIIAEDIHRPALPAALHASRVVAVLRGDDPVRVIEAGVALHDAGITCLEATFTTTGGPGHVRDLRGPLPDIPFVPTGGISVEDAGSYLRAGAVAVGLGSALTGRLDNDDDLGALRDRARSLLRTLAAVPAP